GWQSDNRVAHSKEGYHFDLARAGADMPSRCTIEHGVWPAYATREDFHACAASAIAAAIEVCRDRHGIEPFQPSIRFIYYVGRYLQRRENVNSGASIYATLRACHAIGFCPEARWSLEAGAYDQSPGAVYREAADYGITEFRYLNRDLGEMKACLCAG